MIVIGVDQSDTLLRLVRGLIGDGCPGWARRRLAREHIERRLAAPAGMLLPPGQNGDAAWQQLPARSTKSEPRRPGLTHRRVRHARLGPPGGPCPYVLRHAEGWWDSDVRAACRRPVGNPTLA